MTDTVKPGVSREVLVKLSKQLADQGMLIGAGWLSLRAAAIPRDAGQAQLDSMRMAFFAGAQHLWGSVNSILEEGDEPTDNDMNRMNLINEELANFVNEIKARIKP